MSALLLFLTHFPVWVRMTVVIAFFLIMLELILWSAISRILLHYRLKKILSTPEKAFALFFSRYNKNWILARSFVIERFAKRYGKKILYDIKMDDLWIERLAKLKLKKDFIRVLNYAYDKGAFQCFLVTLKKKSLLPILLKHAGTTDKMPLFKILSLSGNGENFERKKAYKLYKNKIDEIRELSFSPEWKSRYFALSLMLYDKESISQNACFEALDDPNFLIRKTLISECNFVNKTEDYKKLQHIMLGDPIYEVRYESYKRIKKDFSNLYKIELNNLSDNEALHLMDFLETDSSQAHNIALKYLKSKNTELSLAAALFLNKSGMLEKLLLTLDKNDNELSERNLVLLDNAFSVNVTDFLKVISKTKSKTVLLASSKLLLEKGNPFYINILAKKVFKTYSNKKTDELYKNTVTSIIKRGTEQSLLFLKKELEINKNNNEKRELILSEINPEKSIYFTKLIFMFLKDEKVYFSNNISDALLKTPGYVLLPELIDIIKNKNKKTSVPVVLRALNILQKLKLDYSLGFILENFYLYDGKDSNALIKNLKEFPKEILSEKIEDILSKNDSKLTSAIITFLPDTKDKSYLKYIKKYFNDTDPDIRASCIRSSLKFNDSSVIEHIFECLYDPSERVRVEASSAISEFGKKTHLEKLKLIFDKEESALVKKAIIKGLGRSRSTESINILINKLEVDESIENETIDALSQRIDTKDVVELLNHYKKANLKLKEKIIKIFMKTKVHIAGMLIEMLKDNTTSLNAYITEILENTGYINEVIKKARHRKPEVRKEILKLLMLIGTKSGYKGIIISSKDPEPEIRTMVLKALEKLDSAESKNFLEEFKNDPDKKVRLNAEWAFEKLKAKEIS